ncbi:MAG: hypothetical protein FWE72_04920 [Spirochaetaceae bacterium]|nr:hypothetical protein [Spirochaetaceae bacterium]
MKKYLLIVLALAIFTVPVMADVTLSGAFRIGAIWDIDGENYLARLDRTRVYFNAGIDEYNTFAMEYRGSRHREIGTNADSRTNTPHAKDDAYRFFGGLFRGGNPSGLGEFGYGDHQWVGVYVHRAVVTTDWAKYFDFADVVGLKTQVGYDAFGGFNKLDYMIYGAGSQGLLIKRDLAAKINFDIQGIVKPYFAFDFYAFNESTSYKDNPSSFIVGTGIDFAPIWVELYFIQDGDAESHRAFVAEVEFAQKIDDMKLKVAGVVNMFNFPGDNWDMTVFKVLAGLNAFGADFGLGFMGFMTGKDTFGEDKTYLGQLALSVKYGVTKYLDIQAGGKFAFGDYAKDACNDESFLGAEFGVVVKPGKVSYSLGYAILNDKVDGVYATDTWGLGGFGIDGNGAPSDRPYGSSPYVGGWKGGLLFRVNTSF